MAARTTPAPLPPLPGPGIPVHVRLQQLRTERRLSQRALARLAGIQRDTLTRLELGYTRLPQRRTVAQLALAFGLTEAELRRTLGMHGAVPRVSLSETRPPGPAASGRALVVAALFDRLPATQQQYLEGLLLQWTATTATSSTRGGSHDRRPTAERGPDD